MLAPKRKCFSAAWTTAHRGPAPALAGSDPHPKKMLNDRRTRRQDHDPHPKGDRDVAHFGTSSDGTCQPRCMIAAIQTSRSTAVRTPGSASRSSLAAAPSSVSTHPEIGLTCSLYRVILASGCRVPYGVGRVKRPRHTPRGPVPAVFFFARSAGLPANSGR